MRGELDASYTALDAVPEPLTEAIATSRAAVQAAIDQLGVLQRAIQVDVINALSLSVGFNDNDGD
jgi:predicted lipoprotein